MKTLTALILFLMTALAHANSCAPVAKWSGKLQFDPENRIDNGAVKIHIENAPNEYTHLKGKTIELHYGLAGSSKRQWFDQQKVDVNFVQASWDAANNDGLILATRLDGLKKVSPLESLAASRDNDSITVELKDIAAITDDRIVIESDPILLEGSQVCLMKFVSVNGSTAIVKNWNNKTRSFSTTEEIQLNFRKDLPGQFSEEISLKDIESQAANNNGWNVYIEMKNGQKVVRAIEPYSLFETTASSSAPRTLRQSQTRRDYWDISDEDKGHTLRMNYRPENKPVVAPKLGENFLVAHAFGSYNDHGMTLKYYRGHASIGLAEVVRHPITNDLVYQVIYKQTYGQSGKGIFASTMHWHAYSGDLYRGRMFYRPINDVLYPLGQLGQDISGRNFRLELEKSLDEISAGYRTGFGKGWARVTILTSCVHDSGNILIAVVNDFYKHLKQNKIKGPATDLIKALSKKLGKYIDIPSTFRNPDLLADNVDFKLSTLASARRNLTITIPRNFQDAMMSVFIKDARSTVTVLRTVQTGDAAPNATPKAPSRINSFTGAAVGSLVDFVFAKD